MKYTGDDVHRAAIKEDSPPREHIIQTSAFVSQSGAAAKGNACQLHLYTTPPALSDTPEQSGTQCHSWPHQTEQNTVVVRCFNHQRAIRCCGHGLLATASWWMQSRACASITLLMHGSYVAARKTDGLIWLTFKRLPTTACEIPVWLHQLSGDHSPVAAAKAGGDSDYLIIQWPRNYPLEQLPRPGNALSRYTRRALIYTAEHDLQPNVNIHYRYFAPQYGVEEDSATGSAMRVLADYWAPQFTRLSAVQCSPARGYLLSSVADAYVEVGGYCVEQDKQQ